MTRKFWFAAVALAGLLLVIPAAAAAQTAPLMITDGPRIEYVGHDKAEIAWTTSTGGSSVIHYGTHPNNLRQTAESPYSPSSAPPHGQHAVHRVTINNLQPNTTYYFVVDSGQGQGTGTGVTSPIAQFHTK